MQWFAAHLILHVKLKVKPQQRYPVWENIVLIKAKSEEEAFAKAEQRGREQAGDDDGTFRWKGEISLAGKKSRLRLRCTRCDHGCPIIEWMRQKEFICEQKLTAFHLHSRPVSGTSR